LRNRHFRGIAVVALPNTLSLANYQIPSALSMAAPELVEQQGVRIAVEGCGHGVLHEIYASVAKACELKGWPDVDLLIIGGDFQVREPIPSAYWLLTS
jgi:hypothetical protein